MKNSIWHEITHKNSYAIKPNQPITIRPPRPLFFNPLIHSVNLYIYSFWFIYLLFLSLINFLNGQWFLLNLKQFVFVIHVYFIFSCKRIYMERSLKTLRLQQESDQTGNVQQFSLVSVFTRKDLLRL